MSQPLHVGNMQPQTLAPVPFLFDGLLPHDIHQDEKKATPSLVVTPSPERGYGTFLPSTYRA